MSTDKEDETPARPLGRYEPAVPDYRGVEVGQPPRFRDPKNARRSAGNTIRTHIDADAPFGSD